MLPLNDSLAWETVDCVHVALHGKLYYGVCKVATGTVDKQLE